MSCNAGEEDICCRALADNPLCPKYIIINHSSENSLPGNGCGLDPKAEYCVQCSCELVRAVKVGIFLCALASLVSILFVSAVFCFGTLKTYCCPVGWVCNGFNGDTVKGDPEHPGPWYCEPFLEEDYDTFLIPGLIIVCLVFPALYCIYKVTHSSPPCNIKYCSIWYYEY